MKIKFLNQLITRDRALIRKIEEWQEKEQRIA